MKYLLWLGVLGFVWWLWRKNPTDATPPAVEAPPPRAENMVACAHCGVYLPEGDALPGAGGAYCCPAHRQAGPAKK